MRIDQELEARLLALPPDERARLVDVLQDSLLDESERAFDAELRRRLEDIDAGRSVPIPGQAAHAMVRERLRGRE